MSIFSKADLDKIEGPKYMAIVSLIEKAMTSGQLKENDRLPPQRNLAKALGVTVGTITRAFTEAEIKGLVRGEVGRGTYVIPNPFTSPSSLDEINASGDPIGLAATNKRTATEDTSIFKKTELPYDCVQLLPVVSMQPLIDTCMANLQADGYESLFTYKNHQFLETARTSFANYLNKQGHAFNKDQLVLTYGAQHALSAVVAGLSEPGDIIVAEALSYPGIQAMASRLHRRQVIGVEMDEYGMIPETLEMICARYKPKFLMTVPNLHNPTSITVPTSRREEIAAIAQKHELIIIEDDVYHHMLEVPPPTYASMLPEQTCYIGSLSKSISPGLRLGYIAASVDKVVRLRAALRSSVWMVSPLFVQLGKEIVEHEALDDLHHQEREAVKARQDIAREIFADLEFSTAPTSMQVWLTLPEPWNAVGFAEALREKGIAVLPSWLFALNRDLAPEAIRISLTGIPTIEALREALQMIADLAKTEPQ